MIGIVYVADVGGEVVSAGVDALDVQAGNFEYIDERILRDANVLFAPVVIGTLAGQVVSCHVMYPPLFCRRAASLVQ